MQRDMHTVGEVFETLRKVGQPRTGGRQVWGIDLCEVTQAHHFGTGTGKDTLAERLHSLSGRRGHYIAINCAAIPESLANR